MSFLTGSPAAPPPPPPGTAAAAANAAATQRAAAAANGKGFGDTIKTTQQGAPAPKTATPGLFGG